MDSKLRDLERRAASGDVEAQERLSRELDRADAVCKVYILKEATWEYNDNWYSSYEPDVVHAFRTRERAEKELYERFRKFVERPPYIKSRDWVDLKGARDFQYFIDNYYEGSSRTEELRALGFTVLQKKDVVDMPEYYKYSWCEEHHIVCCIPPEKVSIELAKEIYKLMRENLYEIVETDLA